MAYFSIFVLVASAAIFAYGMIQTHRHRKDWHAARFPKDTEVERYKIEYRKACEQYDQMMKKRPPFGG